MDEIGCCQNFCLQIIKHSFGLKRIAKVSNEFLQKQAVMILTTINLADIHTTH